jgi:hypothetical protein
MLSRNPSTSGAVLVLSAWAMMCLMAFSRWRIARACLVSRKRIPALWL